MRLARKLYKNTPNSLTNLNVENTGSWKMERWWESYVPLEIANETIAPFIDVYDV
jgi:hypothetical protein